ncbi:MAG: DciA family protein [Pseudomonadota bacterium]
MQVYATQVKQLLDHSAPSLSALRKRLEVHKKALDASKKVLPAFLSGHCLDCVISGNKIIVFTDTSAWSSQLRFYSAAILQAVNAAIPGRYDSVHVRVLLPWKPVPDTASPPRLPSHETVAQIRQNAQHTADDHLKRSLIRLSQALEPRGKS